MSHSANRITKRETNDDLFAFRISRENKPDAALRRKQLAAQIMAELSVKRVTRGVIGAILRDHDPLSDTYHAAGQYVCLSVARVAEMLHRPTTRSAVANKASKLSGLNFSDLASAVVHRAATDTLALDVANLRFSKGKSAQDVLPVLALVEDFTAVRAVVAKLATGEPADYSRLHDELLPPVPSADEPSLAGVFAA